jgi:hypothetical protein
VESVQNLQKNKIIEDPFLLDCQEVVNKMDRLENIQLQYVFIRALILKITSIQL